MKRLIFAALLLVSCLAVAAGKKDKAPAAEISLDKLGRVAIAVNDQASLLENRNDAPGMLATASHDMPVVFEATINSMVTPVATIMWKDLRADKERSEKLAIDCASLKLSKVFKEKITAAFAGAGVPVAADGPMQAAVNRAKIAHPVKFADNPNRSAMPLTFEGAIGNSSKHYQDWEDSLLVDLKKDNLADSLLVINVYLWGLRPGGSKVEGSTGEERLKRSQRTQNPADAWSSRSARVVIISEARLLEVNTRELLWRDGMTYTISDQDLTAEKLMAADSALFQHYTRCLAEWYAENLKLQFTGAPPREEWQCAEMVQP